MQSNQNAFNTCKVIDSNVWIDLWNDIKQNLNNLECIYDKIHQMSKIYNMDKKTLMKNFLTYIIRSNLIKINESFLNMVENITHNQQVNNTTFIYYIIHHVAYHIKLI